MHPVGKTAAISDLVIVDFPNLDWRSFSKYLLITVR